MIQPARSAPERVTLSGRYVWLEPLDERHVDDLFALSTGEDGRARYDYLPTLPPDERQDVAVWAERQMVLNDPLCYAVTDVETGRCLGRQSLMNIVPDHGVIELGGILWGRDMARTRKATEAFFLAAGYVFDDLGYRRFEWKCNALNEPSRRAALRFGFRYEGIFRQHMIVKGQNRDTAWFGMTDGDWPAIKAGLEAWLAPDNFDADGQQRRKLAFG
jgi:RimJ/RimL family protein N-acetyltransferase